VVYLGVALSFLHQLAGPDLAGHRVLQVLWALPNTGVFWLVLEHRIITPLRNAGRHRMRVADVSPEGAGVVSMVIEGRDLDELQAESGQFFRWRFLTPDLWLTAHPFSLSAPPSSTHLRLTVKTLGDGSARLHHLEPGTWVIAEGSYGAMTAQQRTRSDVLLIAGGVGITPMRALFETLSVTDGQDLLLLYFARTEADVLFRDELDHIADSLGGRVEYLLGGAAGPITAELLHSRVSNLVDRDVFFCGPPGMSSALREALAHAGVADSRFHEEGFAL
jgi:ferredoxin-NADP reductase